jgi:hypothetical protein
MTFGNAWERLNAAVLGLATGSGTPRERLAGVIAHDLRRIRPEADIQDAETRHWFQRIMVRACGVREVGGGCPVAAAVARLTDSEVDEVMIDLVSLYDEVTRQEALTGVDEAAA